MPLTALRFKPGINREITSYSNEGGWRDGDKIRFRFGFPEKIGGWQHYSPNTYVGTARRLHNWVALDGSNYLGVGTHLKYYIEEGESFSDITPVRRTASVGNVTFSATDGSSIITVTDNSHGAFPNDYVTISGALSLGGNITAVLLNKEHQIVATPDGNSYTIDVGVAANSSDTGDGTFSDSTVDISDGTFTDSTVDTSDGEYTDSTVDTSDGTFTDSTVDTTVGSITVTMDDTSAVTVGDTISGLTIPVGTTVGTVVNGTTLQLSQAATANATNITATFFNEADSKTVTMDDTSSVTAGDSISGTGIPSGATVESVDDGTTLTVSQSATADGTDITATFVNDATARTVTMDDTSAVTADDSISGTGIPSGTTVVSVDSGTSLTISQNATADGTNITATFVNQTVARTVTMDDTSSVVPGSSIAGAGIPSGTTVVSVDSGTSLTISQNATADSTNITAVFNNVTAVYQINTGLDSQVGGTGWGSSTWSRDTWGSGSSVSTATELRLWSHDNFGEDLIINPRDGAIYYWDKSSGTSTRAVEIGALGGANETPVIAKQVLVSDADRHVIAFGTNPQGSSTQDPLLIRFSDQESITEWEATATTTAGDLRLGSGSEFVQAIETKREILVWTDTALHSMRFIGPPFTFGMQQLANNITIMGPGAATGTEDFVFWMGIDNFYVYAGQTQQLPCTVKEYVFNDFNTAQKDKVVSGINSEFGEVWWFYPSFTNSLANGGTGEIDRYVVYNYNEKVWYYGNLARTAWLDRGTRNFPLAAGIDGYLYNHEFGYDDVTDPIEAHIESSPIDIQDGDDFTFIGRVIPDMTFEGSTSLSNPQATFTVKARNFPGATFDNTDSGDTVRTSSSPVETYTNQLYLRARGRSFALRVESDSLGTKWKLGTPRIEIRTDGKR